MAKKGKLDMQFVVDTKKPAKNIKELQTRIEKLRDTIEGAPLGSDEFNRLTGQLSNASSEMKVLEKNMEGLEPQQKAEAFLKMGEGIVGSFAVAQGALGLMGIENENLEKIQVRVQSAIAIATGIRMMSEAALMAGIAKRVIVEKAGLVATKAGVLWSKAAAVGNGLWAVGQAVLTGSIGATSVALVALKAAIMATGIGALALLIIGLVVAVFSYVSATDSSTAAQEREAAATRASRDALIEKTNAVLDQAKALDQTIQREYALIDAETESEKTLLKKQHRLEDMNAHFEYLIATQESNNELLAEHGHDTAWLARNASVIEGVNQKITAYEEQIRVQNEAIRTTESEVAAEAKAEADRAASRARGKARRNKRKADAESLRKLSEELLLLEEQDLEKRAQLKREQDLANELAAAGEIRDKTIRLETLAEIQAIYDQEEKNRLQKLADEKLAIENAAWEKKIEENDKWNEEQLEKQKEQAEEQKQIDQEVADNAIAALEAQKSARQDFGSAVSSSIVELGGLFKEGSKAAKAAALTDIAINTGLGFVQGLDIAQKSAKAAGPAAALAFPIFYATQIGAVLAAANKAKSILGAGGSTPSPDVTSEVNDSISTPQSGSFTLSGGQPEQPPLKAYVVTDDMTDSQSQLEDIRQESTI